MDIANLTAIQLPGAADPWPGTAVRASLRKDGKPSGSRSDGLRTAMDTELASDDGKVCFAKRQYHRAGLRPDRRAVGCGGSCAGGLGACDAEWSCCAGPTTRSVCGRPSQATGGQLSRHPGGDAATAVRPLMTCPQRLFGQWAAMS
jgi:hypothetical protein